MKSSLHAMIKGKLSGPTWKTLRFYGIALLLILLFIRFVACLAIVHGPSMEDTLRDGDIIVVWRLHYAPKPGDVILTDNNNPLGVPLAKRVIAMEGQSVIIDKSGVWVDDVRMDEPYLRDDEWERELLGLWVPEGQVFLLGDNRDYSVDSRKIGCTEADGIQGKAMFRLWPPARFGKL